VIITLEKTRQGKEEEEEFFGLWLLVFLSDLFMKYYRVYRIWYFEDSLDRQGVEMLNPCYTRQRLGVCRRGGEIYFILFSCFC